MNLDRVEKTWDDIETVWKTSFSKESRKQFLEKQVSDARLAKLREFITSDLIETKENRARVDRLFNQFEKVKQRLASCGEIEDLNEFFWSEEEAEQIAVNLDEFQVLVQTGCNEIADLIGRQKYCSYYEMKKGSIVAATTNMNSEHLLTFYSLNDVLFWMMYQGNGIAEKSDFVRGVYASLIKRINEQGLSFPIAFYAYGSAWKRGESQAFVSGTKEAFASDLLEFSKRVPTAAGGEVTVVSFE